MSLPGSGPNRLNLLRMWNSLWRPTTPELKALSWDFAGGPVVRTLSFYHSRHRLHPWSGNWNPSCRFVEPKDKQANKTPPQFTTTRTFHTTQSDRPHKARWPSRVQSWEVSGESWGSQPTPTIPVQQENVKQTHEEMTFDTKRRPCYCRWRIARVHFHFIFLWNLNGIICSRIWVVLVSHWWRFLMICNSTFDDLNFLQWNCQKKSKM